MDGPDTLNGKTAARRAAVAEGRAQAAVFRAAAAAGERVYPGGEWAGREREAIDACRALAAFLAHHPADPVARAITTALTQAPSL